jgi:PGF-pre-PGF domain-containing protein
MRDYLKIAAVSILLLTVCTATNGAAQQTSDNYTDKVKQLFEGSVGTKPPDLDKPVYDKILKQWHYTGRNFVFEEIHGDYSVNRIEISTAENISKPAVKISSRALDNENTTYGVYEIRTTINNTEITNADIRFTVDRDFTGNYDRVYMERYHKGWQELNTTIYEREKDSITYTAETLGFSLFAIRGEKIREKASDNESQMPICGDGVCNQTEECRNDCGDTGKSEDIDIKIILAFISVSVLLTGFGGYKAIRYVRRKRIEEDTRELKRKLSNNITELRNKRTILDKINRAEQQAEKSNYRKADQFIKKARELISSEGSRQ